MASIYQKEKLSIHQKMVGDAVRIGRTIPYIHTLVELDATNARSFLRAYRRSSGVNISFSTYLMTCCAKAIQQDVSIQRMKSFGNSTILFEEVDLFYPTESNTKTTEWRSLLVRNAGQRSLVEIHERLQKENHTVSTKHQVFMKLPWLLR